MAVLSLSYKEFSTIVFQFDERCSQTNPRIQAIPRTEEEQSQYQRSVFLVSSNFRLNPTTDRLLFYLTNSVTDLFMLYRRSPALSRHVSTINSDDTILNRASEGMLNALGVQPTREEVPLRFFNQLMTHVLEDHLQTLDLHGRISLLEKIIGNDQIPVEELVQGNSIPERVQRNMLMYRTGLDWIKMQLHLTSWKVQLMFANFLTSPYGRFMVFFASGCIVLGTMIVINLFNEKLAALLLNLWDKTYYAVIGRTMGSKQIPSLKERAAVISKTLAILATPFVSIAFFLKFVNPFLPLGLRNAIAQGILGLVQAMDQPDVLQTNLTAAGNAWATHISNSINQAAQGTIVTKIDFAKEKWNTLALHPERL